MKEKEIEAAWHGFVTCEQCGIRNLVLFADLTSSDFCSIHLAIEDIWLPPGGVLYRPGDAADALFTVREGLLKLEQYLSDGTQRIVSLLGMGDVAGIEASVADVFETAAVALQPTKVCRIPKGVVSSLSPKLYTQLMKKWHASLQKSHECIRELSTGAARQRVARLFLMLSPKGAEQCRLFSREDVGALLGITTETASKVVAEMKRGGSIQEIASNVFVRNMEALEKIADAAA